MDKPNNYDVKYIEQYLNGELDDKESASFEAEMDKDKFLAEKVASIKNFPEDLYAVEKERLKGQVKDWIKTESASTHSLEKAEPAKKIRRFRPLGIAAAILLLVMAVGYLFGPFSSPNLYSKTEHYIAQHHKSPVVLMASSDDLWEAAIQLYRARDFDEMKASLQQMSEKGNLTTEQKFYTALAHLYTQPAQLDEALSYFDQSESQDPSMYAEEISWYRALIYIQKDELGKAQQELTKIKSSKLYGSDAEVLLDDLVNSER